MTTFNEHALELSIMELFQQEGYTYTSGEEIHKEVSDVLLRDDMRLYLRNRYKIESITPLEIERIRKHYAVRNRANPRHADCQCGFLLV